MSCFKSLPNVLALLVVLLLCRYSTPIVNHHDCSPPPPSAITVPNVESGIYDKWRPSNLLRPQIGRCGTDSLVMFSVSQVEHNGLWCQVRNNHTAGMSSNIGDWYYPTPLNGTTLVPTSTDNTAPYLSLKCTDQTGLIIVGNVTDYQGIVRCVTTVPNLSRQANYFGVYSDEVYNNYNGPNVDSNMKMKLLSSRAANTFKFNLIFNVSNGPPSKISCVNGTQKVKSSDIVREVIRSHYVSNSQPDITRVTLTQTLTIPRPYNCTVTVEGRVNITMGKYDFVTKGTRQSTAIFTVAGTPTAVRANRIKFNTVEVSWNSPLSGHQPAGYEVFYQSTSVSSQMSGGNVSDRNIVISGLTKEQYTIFVVSYGEEGDTVLPSPHSNEVILLPIPTITSVWANISSIMLSWDIPSQVPSEYIITYMCYLACNLQQNLSNIDSVSNEVNTYTISPLQAGTICEVNMTAVFGSNNNTSTDTASVSTTSAAPTGGPDELTHTLVDNTSIIAMWDTIPCPHQRGPITGYKLFYSDGTNNVTVDIYGGNHRLYDIKGLTPSTRYTIAVAAVNDGGTGPYSDPPLTVWTLNYSKFELKRKPNLSSYTFFIMVSWTPPLLTPSYYNISYLCSLFCDSQQISENSTIVAGNVSTHTVHSLNAGSRCTVSVTAVFGSNTSNTVTNSNITSSVAPQIAPSRLSNIITSSSLVYVTWMPVPCLHQRGVITGYKLRYSSSNNITTVVISGQGHRMYNLTGLTPSTRYTIAVAAVNDGGTGPYSDPPLTVWTLSSTGTNVIGADGGPVIAITLLVIIVMITAIIIPVVVAVIKLYRKTNKATVLHMGENPSYSITTFSKKADCQHNKISNKAVTDVTHLDENPSYCITTFNKRPNDDCGTNLCAAANTPHKQTELDGNMYATVGVNPVDNNDGAAEETTEGAKHEKKAAEYRNLNIVRVPQP